MSELKILNTNFYETYEYKKKQKQKQKKKQNKKAGSNLSQDYCSYKVCKFSLHTSK